MTISSGPALQVHEVTKSFGATKALQDVSLRVEPGTVHGLLGQNGAGKSTLVKIMTGVLPHTSYEGELRVGGRPVRLTNPQDARGLGIGYVPQEIDVAEHLTVTENVLAGHLGSGLIFRRRSADARCATILARLGVKVSPRAVVSTLSAAQRQMLMIARALAMDPTVLILDEPTTSLADSEAAALGDVLLDLRQAGLAIVYITHRVREVLAICDAATVLRDGRTVQHLDKSDLSADRIVTGMAGRAVTDLFPGRRYQPGPVTLSARNLTVTPAGSTAASVNGVSFDLHRGEILGLAGLLGAGRSEVLSAIYGAVRRGGSVTVDGSPVRGGHPKFAGQAGIAMVTEERKREGLLFNLPVRHNITLGSWTTVASAGFIRRTREQAVARRVITDLEVKTPRLDSRVEHLSGGNQQKLLIGRALLTDPKVLILDEPTKGVDIGTRQQIYRLMGALADKGLALLVVSSELHELLGMCDRFLVLADGRVVDEFVKGQGDEARILSAVAGATESVVA